MEAKTIHNSNISFVEVLAALVEFFTLCALFLVQGTAQTAEQTRKSLSFVFISHRKKQRISRISISMRPRKAGTIWATGRRA